MTANLNNAVDSFLRCLIWLFSVEQKRKTVILTCLAPMDSYYMILFFPAIPYRYQYLPIPERYDFITNPLF